MPESRDIRPPGGIDLLETRRRFLLAREQAAQESTRFRAVCAMRHWPPPRRDHQPGEAGRAQPSQLRGADSLARGSL